MKNLSFGAYQDVEGSPLHRCNRASNDFPLTVNCAGRYTTEAPFTTYNALGRVDYYLMHILSGELEISIAGKAETVQKGSAVIFPPNESYHYTYCGGEPLSYEWVHFTGSEALSRIRDCGFSKLPEAHVLFETETLSRHFSSLFGAFSKNDIFRDRELSAILECLLIALGRACAGAEPARRGIDASLHYLMTAYAEDIRIPTLAAMEHLSTPRYNARFKEQLGISPTQYLLRLRMGAACDLLKNTELSVKEIAIMCGYRDPYFFSRAFKSFTGFSPRAYRRGETAEKR